MQGNSVPSMSVIPWSKALLVVMEASGQVLRGSGGPHSRPSQPGPTRVGQVVTSTGPEEPWRSSCPAEGGLGRRGPLHHFQLCLVGTVLLGQTAHKLPLGMV